MITCELENGNEDSFRHAVVHCIVVKDNKILLEKRAEHLLDGGMWALPGGFMDRDETAEQAALRELKEETGWTAEILDMLRIITRPDRPHEDRQNIAIDFILNPLEKIGDSDHEVTDMAWHEFDKLPPAEQLAFDHYESIQLYLKYRREKFPIPLWRN
jgi:8-oxo-dGTP diphosphatase